MAKSPCTRCSKIRCFLFGIVLGMRTQFRTGTFCGGDGAICVVHGFKEGDYNEFEYDSEREFRLGDKTDDFMPFLRKLYLAFKMRVTGKTANITDYYLDRNA